MIDPSTLPSLHRTPLWLRWRGPWRFRQHREGDGYRWRYLSRADYRELFGR